MGFLRIDELRKMTASMWMMVLSIIMATVVSGCLLEYRIHYSEYIEMDTWKLLLTAIVATLPACAVNTILSWCILEIPDTDLKIRSAITIGCLLSTIIFIILAISQASHILLWVQFFELVVVVMMIYTRYNNEAKKKVRQLNKIHIILFVLNMVALMFILQIVFGLIPLVKCGLSPERVSLINSMTVDLSIGVITSTLFYYLLVYLPAQIRNRRVRQMNQGRIDYLAKLMQCVVAYFCYRFQLKMKSATLVDVDFNDIPQDVSFTEDSISFWFSIKKDCVTNLDGSTELGFLYQYLTLILNVSTTLHASNTLSLDDVNLQTTVMRIKDSQLISNVQVIYGNRHLNMYMPGVAQSIKDFFFLFQELSKYTKLPEIVVNGEKPQGSIPIIYQ